MPSSRTAGLREEPQPMTRGRLRECLRASRRGDLGFRRADIGCGFQGFGSGGGRGGMNPLRKRCTNQSCIRNRRESLQARVISTKLAEILSAPTKAMTPLFHKPGEPGHCCIPLIPDWLPSRAMDWISGTGCIRILMHSWQLKEISCGARAE